jgi:phosphopantothenoylcysteine decarboxylase/phosphopantothenate--cysteine ligase
MAAAVADYTPEQRIPGKITKNPEELILKLIPTVDILTQLGRRADRPFLVGFCLTEKEKLKKTAYEKFKAKNLDMIVANPLENMGSDEGEALVITKHDTHAIPRGSKETLADKILTMVLNEYKSQSL